MFRNIRNILKYFSSLYLGKNLIIYNTYKMLVCKNVYHILKYKKYPQIINIWKRLKHFKSQILHYINIVY